MVQKLSELFLLGLILTVFIASAMGLANSVDTPQYFTTEALIQNQNVDMLAFLNDPHFFVQPDYFYHEGQIMNVRGYTTSVLAIPFHWAAQPLQHVLNTSTFPTSIQSPNFSYETWYHHAPDNHECNRTFVPVQSLDADNSQPNIKRYSDLGNSIWDVHMEVQFILYSVRIRNPYPWDCSHTPTSGFLNKKAFSYQA